MEAEAVNPQNIVTINGQPWPSTGTSLKFITIPACPDLLSLQDIGEADGLRGKVVRAFFWLMEWWPPKT